MEEQQSEGKKCPFVTGLDVKWAELDLAPRGDVADFHRNGIMELLLLRRALSDDENPRGENTNGLIVAIGAIDYRIGHLYDMIERVYNP